MAEVCGEWVKYWKWNGIMEWAYWLHEKWVILHEKMGFLHEKVAKLYEKRASLQGFLSNALEVEQ